MRRMDWTAADGVVNGSPRFRQVQDRVRRCLLANAWTLLNKGPHAMAWHLLAQLVHGEGLRPHGAPDEWNVGDGVAAEYSPEYRGLVHALEGLIRDSAFDLVNGNADRAAAAIVAHLAHVHSCDVAPEPLV
jgi:hypothetical protein